MYILYCTQNFKIRELITVRLNDELSHNQMHLLQSRVKKNPHKPHQKCMISFTISTFRIEIETALELDVIAFEVLAHNHHIQEKHVNSNIQFEL